jgi:hypothetical protein
MFQKYRRNKQLRIQITTLAQAHMALLDTIAILQLQALNPRNTKTQRTIKQAELNGVRTALTQLQHIELVRK